MRFAQRALAGLAAAATVISACGGPSGAKLSAAPPTANADDSEVVELRAYPVAGDWFVGTNNFGLVLAHLDGTLVRAAEVSIAFFDLRDRERPRLVAEVEAVESAPGDPPLTNAYYANAVFPVAGLWGAEARAQLSDGRRGVARVAFSVATSSGLVAPGQPAPRSDNLTRAEVDDIRLIDSGKVPNRMHDWKIGQAIAQGWPVVVVFATPGYCTSLACGPVVEEVQALADAYGDRVAFVHIEVWANPATGQVSPAVRSWLVRSDGGFSEPWVFVVDREGVIYDRWAGPVSRELLEPSVAAVANGALWRAGR